MKAVADNMHINYILIKWPIYTKQKLLVCQLLLFRKQQYCCDGIGSTQSLFNVFILSFPLTPAQGFV